MFDIREFVEFNAKGRAVCPSCVQSKGEEHRKQNLSCDLSTGAYHCHAGCTPQDIRAALGHEGDRVVPTAQKVIKDYSVSETTVQGDGQRLVNNLSMMKYLAARGIDQAMVNHYRLGLVYNRHQVPSIAIPYPASGDRYFRKLRIDPLGRPNVPWTQKGIYARLYWGNRHEQPTQVWFCEGEWDAIVLGWAVQQSKLPITVVCGSAGCGTVPTRDELDQLPPGVPVIIWFDRNDKPTKAGTIPGDEGAKKLARVLGDRARIGMVPMPDGCDVHGWDITDAFQRGYTLEDFQRAAEQAKPLEPAKTTTLLKDRMISHRDLLARAPEYVDFLIPDLLTYELYVLVSPPRSGKSLMMMTLAHAIASGQDFLGRPVTQGTVLYINLEDGDAKVRERSEYQDWNPDIPVYWLDKFKLEALDELKECMDALDDLQLVIIDTLSRAKSSAITESSAEMSQLLEPLQELAKEREVCIMICHHTGKIHADQQDAKADIFDNIRGSSAIRATCRGAWMLAPSDNCYRLITENGYAKEDLKVRFNPETSAWKLIGEWNPHVDGTHKERIMAHLRIVNFATAREISEATYIPLRSVGKALERLQGQGLVGKRGGRGIRNTLWSHKYAICATDANVSQLSIADTASDIGVDTTKNTIFSKDTACMLDACASMQATPFKHIYGHIQAETHTEQGIQNPPPHTTKGDLKSPDSSQDRDLDGNACFRQPNETGDFTDCEVFLEGSWHRALYRRESNRSHFSRISKKLEQGHLCDVLLSNGRKKLIQFATSDIRRDSDAN